MKALFPTGLLIAFLIITRIHQLPFKAMMNDATIWFSTTLGALGTFEISKGLIFTLKRYFLVLMYHQATNCFTYQR